MQMVVSTSAVKPVNTAVAAPIQPGKYSIERILALEEYSRTKSIWHVLAVIVATPLLPLMALVAYEMPPLQPVEAGWQANWVFLTVRLGVGMAIVSECGLIVVQYLIPELANVLHVRIRVVIALVSGTAYIFTTIALARAWGFPVPFTTSLANPTGGSSFLMGTIAVARKTVAADTHLKRQLLLFCCFILTIPVMTIVYPVYMALFLSVDRSYQPFVMLLVPAIKILFRKLIIRITAEWEDLVPIMVIFSIELFNSLYQVVCVQSGGSVITTAAVMGIDLLHALRSQWKLHHNTAKLQKVLSIGHDESLLQRVCALCEDATVLQTSLRLRSQELQTLRVRSALSRSGLSNVGRSRLETIDRIGVFSSGKQQARIMPASITTPVTPIGPSPLAVPSWKVVPWKGVFVSDPTTREAAFRRLSRRKLSEKTAASVEQSDAIVEAARMLFRSEYLLLGEYLECIVP